MPKIASIIKFVFLVFIYTLPLDKLVGINSMSIIVLAVIALFDFIPSLKQTVKSKLILISIPALLFIGYGISGIFSHDIQSGIDSLQVKLSLLIMPLIFISQRIRSGIDRHFIFTHFISIMAVVMFYCLGFNFIVRYLHIANPYIINDYMPWEYFSFTFANPTGTQSIYLGYFCSFALLLVIYQLFQPETKKTFYILTGVLLLTGLVMNGAKMASIAFILLGTLECILLISKQKRIIAVSGIAVITCMVIIFASQNPYLKNRFSELAPSNWKIPMKGETQNSVSLRFAILDCGFSLLKENWLLGIPAGDLQSEMNHCYLSNNYHEELAKFSFDNHNQFLNTWISLGIAGFVLLIAMFVGSLMHALKNKDVALVLFVTLIFLSFLPENMLCTQKGVVFFSFFYCLLLMVKASIKNQQTNL